MTKIYFYKMMTDNLGAPNVENGLLSLALCKPGIRRKAEENNIIFGFGSDQLEKRLIYVAVVTQIQTGRKYYMPCNRRRDAIYAWESDTFRLLPDALYHKDGTQYETDLGQHPTFANARILLSDDFRYFGSSGDCSYENTCPELKQLLATAARPYRVNHSTTLRNELLSLKASCWEKEQGAVTSNHTVPAIETACRSCSSEDNDENYDEC